MTIQPATDSASAAAAIETLTDLLVEAEAHHGPYEATAPKHHWSAWYAAYINGRQHGRNADAAAADASEYVERIRP